MTDIGYASTQRPPSAANLVIHRNKCLRCAKTEPYASNPDYLCEVGREHLLVYQAAVKKHALRCNPKED